MADKFGDLYLLQDGTYAPPGDCAKSKDGVLRNKNSGLAVCLYADGTPQTLKRDAEVNMNVQAAKIDVPEPEADEADAGAVFHDAKADAKDQADAKAKAAAPPAVEVTSTKTMTPKAGTVIPDAKAG